MGYKINTEQVSELINNFTNSFDSVTADPSSIKTAVYLILLNRQHEPSSYQDIAEQMTELGLIEGEIEDMTLRNSMSQIVKSLERDKLYEIEKTKSGKQALYRLVKRGSSEQSNSFPGVREIVRILTPNLPSSPNYASMEYVAERLMEDRQMPFYGIYLPMRAASRWVLFSEKEAELRRRYEGSQCEELLGTWFKKYAGKEISIIGLGVGEGIGEIEIIERLLKSDHKFQRIHYCAIDINSHLLLDHVERLRDKFKTAIKEGRLVCGVVCGNFLKDFSALIEVLQSEFTRRGMKSGPENGFLAEDSGVLISVLGNVLGNLDKASEWAFFQPIKDGLKGRDLAFLLGISVKHQKEEHYTRDADDLLLATPKYLTHELGILKSHQPPDDTSAPEFALPDDEAAKNNRCPPVGVAKYQGDGIPIGNENVQGDIYVFHYKTQWDLTMEIEDNTLLVPKGSSLLLYNVIKFDLTHLIAFLESKGFKAATSRLPKTHEVDTKNGKRVYAVFAVTT